MPGAVLGGEADSKQREKGKHDRYISCFHMESKNGTDPEQKRSKIGTLAISPSSTFLSYHLSQHILSFFEVKLKFCHL